MQGIARKGPVNDVGFGVQLKKHVKEAAARKFGSDVKLIDRILELEIGVKSVVFGTLYKDMKVSQTHTLSQTYSLSLSHTHTQNNTLIRAHSLNARKMYPKQLVLTLLFATQLKPNILDEINSDPTSGVTLREFELLPNVRLICYLIYY